MADQRNEAIVTVECHQALYGYGDGHELLASSVSIPRSIRSTLLMLSDLSGPSVVEGFREYCTAYPIRAGGLYAMSRTWYAAEMPRPGCVWTHTLLLPVENLGSIADMALLAATFYRPSEDDRRTGFRRYTKPLRITWGPKTASSRVGRSESETAGRVLNALYGAPSSPVIICADNASQLEHLVFAIWSQQWPRLRGAFSFCTGSLGLRSSADFPFDLQVVPQSLSRQFASLGESGAVLLSAEEKTLQKTEEWIMPALVDLQSDVTTAFRRFLWMFGSDEEGGRGAFGRVCRIYALLDSAPPDEARARRLVEALAIMYPEPTNGLKLKRTLLSYLDGAIGSVERPLEEQLLVTEMLLSRSFAFGPEIVRPRERASALARADAGRAIELGSRLPSFGVASDDFLFGLADALRPQDVFQSGVSDAMIAHLVRINPFLAVSPLAWATSAERRRELVQSLKASPRIDATLIVSIIKASLDGGADLSVTQDLGDSAGESTVHAFMEWLSATNRPDALQVLSRSRQVLIGRGRAILKWLAVHRDAPIAAFVAASVVLEPSVHVEELGEEFWSNSTRFPILDMERNDALRAASFVLRKALETSSVGAVDGVVASFSVVYEAVALSELPEQVWSMLSAVLPGSWWDWDRCDRMVRGVVRKFARSNWPVQKFIRTFESRKLLERALRFAKWDWESSGYFNEVCQTFRRGMLDVSEAQARALRSLC